MRCFDLTGKKALVTGGTRGLGRGMAEGLMEAGAEVVICGTSEKVDIVCEEFRKRGYCCHGLIMDLRRSDHLEGAFHEAVKMLGCRLDILVNAAGVQKRNSSEVFTKEDWDTVLAVNLTAPFLLCQLAAKQMIEQGKDHQYFFYAGVFRGTDCAGICGQQRRADAIQQDDVQRPGGKGNQHQLYRARLYGYGYEYSFNR